MVVVGCRNRVLDTIAVRCRGMARISDYDRTQYRTNKDRKIGLGAIDPSKPSGGKTGYWGACRHSIKETSDENDLHSPLTTPPIPKRQPALTTKYDGRVKMSVFPENICFVVEGQDHSELTSFEKETWFNTLDGPVTKWMNDLASASPEANILISRMCYDEESGVYQSKDPEYLDFNKKIQLFYFTDLRAMERVGRMNKDHVGLRGDFMKLYGPGGPLSQEGRICLWVETSVLKARAIEAEYIGCAEGTGFMAFQEHPAF